MIRLAAFLGNHGSQYEKTRHNVAWQFAAALPFCAELRWQEKFKGEWACMEFPLFAKIAAESFPQILNAEGELPLPKSAPEKIYFLKPHTFMNLSGESIAALASFFKIGADEILVLHDELELPLGTFGLKWAGGLAGHNGLRSAKATLGTQDFWRIRFGITKPAGRDIADYVLSNFSGDETITMSIVFEKAGELFARSILANDAQRLLPKWSKVKV
ncbi:MAG: aminoacyl-tRNA hydrolase [Treponema sp.]|nr:aminoacyl-tRNA hydrolase [Treponema sp.]